MSNKDCFFPFSQVRQHKGFYNDGDPENSLNEIDYADFFDLPDNDDFPYDTAWTLLCGSCNIFVLALQEAFDYNPYIIEPIDGAGFHAFCQKNRQGKIHYVDARGVTSSFDEFMEIAKQFVHGEYIIRPVTDEDKKGWEQDDYFWEGFNFAKAIINKYSECYLL